MSDDEGRGVKNCRKLCDVIYGQPLRTLAATAKKCLIRKNNSQDAKTFGRKVIFIFKISKEKDLCSAAHIKKVYIHFFVNAFEEEILTLDFKEDGYQCRKDLKIAVLSLPFSSCFYCIAVWIDVTELVVVTSPAKINSPLWW